MIAGQTARVPEPRHVVVPEDPIDVELDGVHHLLGQLDLVILQRPECTVTRERQRIDLNRTLRLNLDPSNNSLIAFDRY